MTRVTCGFCKRKVYYSDLARHEKTHGVMPKKKGRPRKCGSGHVNGGGTIDRSSADNGSTIDSGGDRADSAAGSELIVEPPLTVNQLIVEAPLTDHEAQARRPKKAPRRLDMLSLHRKPRTIRFGLKKTSPDIVPDIEEDWFMSDLPSPVGSVDGDDS